MLRLKFKIVITLVLTEKLCRFLEISFLATKSHALNNEHRGKGCNCYVFHGILVR